MYQVKDAQCYVNGVFRLPTQFFDTSFSDDMGFYGHLNAAEWLNTVAETLRLASDLINGE